MQILVLDFLSSNSMQHKTKPGMLYLLATSRQCQSVNAVVAVAQWKGKLKYVVLATQPKLAINNLKNY